MRFKLMSTITDHRIDLNNLAERVIIGPQEEVLRTIDNFNQRFQSDIRCTKRFRWEPGFYKKLNKLQIFVMDLERQPKTVQSAFNRVENNNWHYRHLNTEARKIDNMLYQLRANNLMFQDNSEAVTENTTEWFNTITNTAEELNNADNGYLFDVYHAIETQSNKDCIVFVITIDGFTMEIGNGNVSMPIECGKIKMFIALDMLQIIGAAISNSSVNFGRDHVHSGYWIGGQYFPLIEKLQFPYISGGSNHSARQINFDNVSSYERLAQSSVRYAEIEDWVDPYAPLCLGDLKKAVLTPLAAGRLDETMFWLNKWGNYYHISRTSPLNNYSTMYFGKPKALYTGDVEGIFSYRSANDCMYTPPENIKESYCEIHDCLLTGSCTKYENAYITLDDELLAIREQVLANYMISRNHPWRRLIDESDYQYFSESSLNHIDAAWDTAENHWDRMHANLLLHFNLNVDKEAMLYIMASSCREVSYDHTMDDMANYDMTEDGFYGWLDHHYSNRTITPEVLVYSYPSDTLEDLPNEVQVERDQMERRLLEHYSATGRGIPIQPTERG